MKETGSGQLELEKAQREAKEVKFVARNNVISEFKRFTKETKKVWPVLSKARANVYKKEGVFIPIEEQIEIMAMIAERYGKNFGKVIRAQSNGEFKHNDEMVSAEDYQEAQDMLDEMRDPREKNIWSKFLSWLYLKKFNKIINKKDK